MDSRTPPVAAAAPGAATQLEGLKRELAQRYRQLAERWQVSTVQVERIFRLLGGRLPDYTSLEFIGAGGMGEVWRAEHKTLHRRVAIKLITPEAGTDPAFAERFRREAPALAELDHPHIVRVYDFGVLDNLYYLVMEYIPADLRAFLSLLQSEEKYRAPRKRVEAVLRLFLDLCSAVAYAHGRGVIHRDLKPANVLWDGDAGVKLADFGLARRLDTQEDNRLTAPNEVVGTLAYMAPEQLTAPETVDQRADIYALGALLYELLTGNLPQGRFEPPSARLEDKRLDAVVFQALAADPARRYASVSALQADLEKISANPPPTLWSRLGTVWLLIWIGSMVLQIVLSLEARVDFASFHHAWGLLAVFGISWLDEMRFPRLRQPAWAVGCVVCLLANLMGPLLGWPQASALNLSVSGIFILLQFGGIMRCVFVILSPLAERARSLFVAVLLLFLLVLPPLALCAVLVVLIAMGDQMVLPWMPLALFLTLIGYIEWAAYARQRTSC